MSKARWTLALSVVAEIGLEVWILGPGRAVVDLRPPGRTYTNVQLGIAPLDPSETPPPGSP